MLKFLMPTILKYKIKIRTRKSLQKYFNLVMKSVKNLSFNCKFNNESTFMNAKFYTRN